VHILGHSANCSSRLPTSDGSASKGKQQTSEPVHILKRSFARTVSMVSIINYYLHFLHVPSYLTKLKGVHVEVIYDFFFYLLTKTDMVTLM